MAVTAERVAVGATATPLNTATTAGQTLLIKNEAGALDLGNSSVTLNGGFAVATTDGIVEVELDAGDVLFGISDVTGATVQVLRT